MNTSALWSRIAFKPCYKENCVKAKKTQKRNKWRLRLMSKNTSKTDCGARLSSSSKTQQPSFNACKFQLKIKNIYQKQR